jgi:hypothetical protein
MAERVGFPNSGLSNASLRGLGGICGPCRKDQRPRFQPVANAAIAVLTIAILSAASFFVAALAHVVLKLLPFGFRDWRFADTFFLKFGVTFTPNSVAYATTEEVEGSGWAMRHSAVYGSGPARAQIVEFIAAHAQVDNHRHAS